MNKPTLIAVGVFAALLLAFFATREKEVSVGVQKFEATKLSKEEIATVELKSATSTLTLTRSANGWTVADAKKAGAGYAADDGQVQSLLSGLADFKASDFVTEKTDKHGELEVDDAKGTAVKATGANKTLELVLGKASKSGGAYVRKAGSSAVFVTQSGLQYLVKQGLTAWRKKTVVSLNASDLTSFVVTRADGASFSLKAGEGGSWTSASELPKGFRFSPSAATALVNQFATLTAQDFAEGAFEAPQAHGLVATLKDGKSVTLKLAAAKRDDGTVAAQVDGDAQVYLLPGYQAQALDKKLDDLRELTLVDFDPAKATKLVLTAASKKTVVVKEGEAWKLVEPKAAPEFDAAQVPTVLNRLKGLRGLSWVGEAPKTAFPSPAATVEVTVDGKPVRVVFGAETGSENRVYVKGSIDDATYTTGVFEKTQWSSGPELFKKPPPPPDFGQMNGLDQLPPEIRAKLMEQLRQQRN
ncbi:MAG: DUF4340 domain-containing protein [Myxococcaceae bacterium]|nr:DUF4340 domain-containing protein [Myxococcaceae bacterium]